LGDGLRGLHLRFQDLQREEDRAAMRGRVNYHKVMLKQDKPTGEGSWRS
jgi:hypothetical protein